MTRTASPSGSRRCWAEGLNCAALEQGQARLNRLGVVAFLLPGVPVHLSAPRPEFARCPGVGGDLKLRRRALGLKQSEAAARIGVVTTTYADWEVGRKNPDHPHYPAIIAFLGREPWSEPQTLAERLKAARLRLGFGREGMARLVGIADTTLHACETGRRPTARRTQAVLEAFLAATEFDRPTAPA